MTQPQPFEDQVLPEGLVLRRAVAGDYETVLPLERLLFALHQKNRPDYFNAQGPGYSREAFDSLLAQPGSIAWVALLQGTLVGLCFGRLESIPASPLCGARTIAYLEDLAVSPAYRGAGIGTARMAAAKSQASQAGAVSLELCVWSFNQSALRLYQKLGLQIQFYQMELPLTGSAAPDQR